MDYCVKCQTTHMGDVASCDGPASRWASVVMDFKPNGHVSDERPGQKSLRRGIGARKAHYGRLEKYANLVRSGVQPASTQTPDIEQADRLSQRLGRAYNDNTDRGYAAAEKAVA